MGRIIKVTQSNLKDIISKVLFEQTDNDEWVKISPETYLDIMKYASYNAKGVSMLPQYRGKKIWITGDLIVKDLPIKSLEGIGYVEGNLDISRTGINDISFINVKGRVSDYESGVDRIRKQKIKQQKLASAQQRRDDDEWGPDSGDDVGIRARAVFEYIENSNTRVNIRTALDNERLSELNKQMESLLEKEKKYDSEGRDLTDIYADIEAVEDEINEINEKLDIYNLIPEEGYGFYRMMKFEVVGNDDLEGAEYAVGTEYEAEKSCEDYLDEQFDSPEYYFSESFLENHINEDEVLDYFRDHYEYDVAENPDVYFSDDDFELSSEQEKRKEQLEDEIRQWEEKQENLDSEIEEPDEYSRMYDQIQDHIDSLQEEIDEMEPDGDPSQDMIDNKVEELLYDVKRNLIDYMKDWGFKIGEYIDRKSAIEDIISTDGVGHILNSYDGNYDEVDIDGDSFIVMRVG